ncbi:MAG: ribosomal protein S18 acetylase RimI-like enzyme [Flavobacterium sp.]|jgi:ribosomal protein S18 acetylase RimI-like enzyme
MNTDSNKIDIIEFNEELKDHIKTLNYEWLEKHFRIETGDFNSLSNPKEHIIDKGGFIYYATLNNEIVATVSLLKKTDSIFEIGKMAVTAKAQGNKIGALLVEHCLTIAKQKQIKKLILYSNTKLEAAIYLYRKYGFIETTLEEGLYERANIKMEKKFEVTDMLL